MRTSDNGFSYILVILDLFSGFAITRALRTKDASEVTHGFYTALCEFGRPKVIQSDDGPEFVNALVKKLAELYNIKLHVSTPHYHRSIGKVERANRTLEHILHKMLESAIAAWDLMLPYATLLYNTNIHSTTKCSPFVLMFGRSAGLENDNILPYQATELDTASWLAHQANILKIVFPTVMKLSDAAREQTRKQFEKSHTIVEPLPIGTHVMARDTNRSSKHEPPFTGPFEVKELKDTGSYLIGNNRDQIQRPRNALKPIPASKVLDQSLYTVDHIVGHRGSLHRPNAIKYLVHWKNFSSAADSWEPSTAFSDQKVISDYWALQAPVRLTKRTREQQSQAIQGTSHSQTKLSNSKSKRHKPRNP
jgi:hypothetical protein